MNLPNLKEAKVRTNKKIRIIKDDYKIDSEMPDEVLVDMVVNFTKEIEKWSQLENKFDYEYVY